MKLSLSVLVVALAALTQMVFAARELTDSTFKTALAEPGAKFVKFYAPWCGHCKRLAPTWDELATAYKGQESKVEVVKVDCTKEKAVCSEKGIRGYPTLMYFKNGGEGEKYQGGRDIDSLKKFINERI